MQKAVLAFLGVCLMAVFYHAYTGLGSTNEKHNEIRTTVDQLMREINRLKASNEQIMRQVKGESGTLKQSEKQLEKSLSDVKEEVLETKSEVGADEDMLNQLQSKVQALEKRIDACACGQTKGQPAATAATQGSSRSTQMVVPPALRMYGAAPPNKPSDVVRTPVKTRTIYDGITDAAHLGGSTVNDTMGQSPSLWTYLLKEINVRSVIDVGCGRGISTRWFLDHNAEVLCLEGSKDAIGKSHLPKELIVQHDFTLGPYWPDKTYDLAWSVEFLEHVGRQYMQYYMPIFHKSALLYVTHSLWGGHHHVEVHPEWWWIARMQAQGFVYSKELTTRFRNKAKESRPDGFNAQHLWLTGLAFINPKVASLPEHAHLFGEPGCFRGNDKSQIPCTGPDALPESYTPVLTSPTKWDSAQAKAINTPGKKCRSDYGFPTGHDGCQDLTTKKTMLRRLRETFL